MRILAAIFIFICGSSFVKTPEQVSIYLIGDSTMANKNSYDFPETGWGQVFAEVFTEAVIIKNYALNGRSTKSFRNEGHWKKVYDQLQKSDYVFVQFGHNDQKVNDTTRFADATTDFRSNLERYVNEIKEKGAIPVLVSPVSRRKFDEQGVFVDQHGQYPAVVEQVAISTQTPFIDLTASSKKLLETLGVEASKDLFMHFAGRVYAKFPDSKEDNTHFSPYGARTIANLVAQELVEKALPLRNWLKKSVYPNTLVYQLPVVNEPHFKKDTFNITSYGAKPEADFLNTQKIQMAIDLAAENGGGTVYLPKGFWLTGPLVLKSNVNLHLAAGALLQFSDNRSDYPVIETTWEGNTAYRCQAPISGKNLTNVAITGAGTMDGAGQVWKQIKKSKLTESQWSTLLSTGGVLNDKKDTWYPTEQSKFGNENASWTNKIVPGKTLQDYLSVRDFLRPNMVSLSNCKNVLIEGITFLNSPAWTLHPLMCEHITIRNVNVKNPWYGQNNDALDLESCSFGVVEGCTFDTGDDAICIKSGRNEEGRKRAKPTHHIIVRNNTVFHGHGGFVIGSEMSGGVHHLYVNNCSFLGTDIGLRFKTTRGRGGVVEDIFISDINMNNILGDAIRFNMYYEAVDPVPLKGEQQVLPTIKAEPINEGTPIFRNFFIENVNCKGAATAIMLRGLPEMKISNINISNANFYTDKGLVCLEADHIKLNDVGLYTVQNTFAQLQNTSNLIASNIKFFNKPESEIIIDDKNSKDISFDFNENALNPKLKKLKMNK